MSASEAHRRLRLLIPTLLGRLHVTWSDSDGQGTSLHTACRDKVCVHHSSVTDNAGVAN